ncbi:MAG: hypothetical protein K2Q25_04245, partial [Mycobacteriaceae bacterium]|nr:hypothetical protein [Mycobacteriaceae bacterium]
VESGNLETLINRLNEVSLRAQHAAVVTTHLETKVWQTYGPLFGFINEGFVVVERARRAAVRRASSDCTSTAENLRTAIRRYASADTLSGESINTQVG